MGGQAVAEHKGSSARAAGAARAALGSTEVVAEADLELLRGVGWSGEWMGGLLG